MNLRLEEIPAHRYAQEVLPLTQTLWGDGRALSLYQTQTTELARTTYGKSSYRTLGLFDGADVLATFKRYLRDARAGKERLRAVGIGAVFTPEPFRGRGYASAMLAMALDDARRSGMDFAFLFSAIHPQFYRQLGFTELPSRSISFRVAPLEGPRIQAEPIAERDWTAIRACFDAMETGREFSLLRSPAIWNWMRIRLAQSATRAQAQPVNLAVREGRTIVAYSLGRREPRHDAYVVDEIGLAGERGRALVPALLRCAAGDLRRIAGWLPPAPVRAVLPRGSVRKRSEAIWMIAPLTPGGTHFLERAMHSGAADGVWSLDHI